MRTALFLIALAINDLAISNLARKDIIKKDSLKSNLWPFAIIIIFFAMDVLDFFK